MSRNSLLLLLFVLGLSSIMSQVLILREFLLAFGGNELIIGIFLSIWMLITGIGAFAGRFITVSPAKFNRILNGVLFMGFMPLLLLFLIDFLRNIVFLPGIQPGIFQILASACALLSVYCFISGYLFSQLAMILKRMANGNMLDKAYAAEAIGSMAGGALFSFFLAYFLGNFETSCVVATLTAATVMWSGIKIITRLSKAIISLIAVSILIYFFFFNGSSKIRNELFPGQEIVETHDTRYGNLTITRLAEQLNFYQNNMLMFTTDNQLANEEAVHYAMVQSENPHQVLLISGGIAGLTYEILKYKDVDRIDYLEIDPEVFRIGLELTASLESDQVMTVQTDARRFVNNTTKQYDVVIMNLPEPATLDLNRYYTSEFFRAVKEKLSVNGILTFSLPAVANYLNDPAARLHSSIYNTCRQVFQQVKIYPAGRNIFVASDKELSYEIGQLIDIKSIETDYVNLYYIDESLMIQRAEYILDELSAEERPNTDFKPVAIYGFLQYWLSQFQFSNRIFTVVTALVLIIMICCFVLVKPVYPGMFAAGFTASSFQVLLLISFQIIVGYVYQSLGAFIAVFMAGLGLGALVRNKLMPECNMRKYTMLQIIMALTSCIIPALITLSSYLSDWPTLVHLLFFVMVLGVSVCTGLIFSTSLQLAGTNKEKSIAVIYGTDMAGSALGAFLTTVFIIPLVGILNAGFIYAIIHLISALNSLRK